MVLVTNNATYAKAKNLRELVALSKTTPGGIFFGGTGPGTSFNMNAGFVLKGLGTNYSEINYNGTQPITLALLRNDVQVLFNTTAAIKTQIDSGAVHPLAVVADERFPEMPTVPTMLEAGYTGFHPVVWSGIFAPKGTPVATLDKIAADMLAVSLAPDMKDKIETSFAGTIPKSTPQIFAKELEIETKQWRDYLAAINFKPQ